MVLVAVKVLSVRSMQPAGVGERISKGEKHNLGAAAPLHSEVNNNGIANPIENHEL